MCCSLEGDLTQLKAKLSASEQRNEKAAEEHAASLAEVKDAAEKGAEQQRLSVAQSKEQMKQLHGKALSAERRTVRKLTNCLSHSRYTSRR